VNLNRAIGNAFLKDINITLLVFKNVIWYFDFSKIHSGVVYKNQLMQRISSAHALLKYVKS